MLRICSFVLALGLLCAGSALSQTTIFDNGTWAVSGTTDSGDNPMDIAITVDGNNFTFSELLIVHGIGGGFPQIFSVKGIGAIRSVMPPPGEFGGTFYATGYWDCDPSQGDEGLIQNMRITALDIDLDPMDNTKLRFTGTSSNLNSFEATNFTLIFHPPTADKVQIDVRYTLVATRDFCINQSRQGDNEGFKIARIASNYLSELIHDSDEAAFLGTGRVVVRADLRNADDGPGGNFIFSTPPALHESTIFLIHDDMLPRNTPTLIIDFSSPTPGQIVPQGFTTFDTDPNADNVDLWGNWSSVQSSYANGETIGTFSYALIARPPSAIPDDQLPVELVLFRALLEGSTATLEWETASETNNAGFEVQHKTEGTEVDFEMVGFVEGAGTTSLGQRYRYRIDDLVPGLHIFRLRQIDFDGMFDFSPEVEILIELPEMVHLSPAFPNPSRSKTQFTLSLREAQQVQVVVYDVLGRQVAWLYEGWLSANEGHQFHLEQSDLPSGLYVIQAIGERFVASQQVILTK